MSKTIQRRRSRRQAERDRNLDALVDEFIAKLKATYPTRIRNRPLALKKQVLSLIHHRLPPYSKKSGRRLRTSITDATNAYRVQKQEVRAGTRHKVNWHPIASDHLPGYSQIQSEPFRRVALKQLRDAVHARLKRRRVRARKS